MENFWNQTASKHTHFDPKKLCFSLKLDSLICAQSCFWTMKTRFLVLPSFSNIHLEKWHIDLNLLGIMSTSTHTGKPHPILCLAENFKRVRLQLKISASLLWLLKFVQCTFLILKGCLSDPLLYLLRCKIRFKFSVF